MKKIKSYIIALAAVAALQGGFSSCQDDFDTPAIDVPEAKSTPNTTIAELKEWYWKDADNYADTIKTRPADAKEHPGERIVIAGRVCSSDEQSNIFKSLVIQDETSQISFSINSYNLYLNYRVGQEIVMDVTDMYIGKYSGLMQFGRPDWYTQGNTYQVSFMSPEFFSMHAELNGLPEVAKVDTTVVSSLGEISQTPEGLRYWQSRLVRLQDVSFQEGGKELFSEYHSSGVNRVLQDANGGTINVRTSGYSTFWNTTLPEGKIDVVGILSYFNSAWQMLLIDGNSCIPAEVLPGTADNPFTVEKAIETIAEGRVASGWVKGYIVGALQPLVTEVTSNDDIQWDAPTLTANSLVLGPTADCRDYSKCIIIQLPMDSPFQKECNLNENASMLGKEIMVKGKLEKELGTWAITGNTGSKSEYSVNGGEVPPAEPGAGATIIATDLTANGETTIDGYTISILKAGGFTAPQIHPNTSAMRTYADNTITVAGGGISSITFVLSSDAGYRYTTLTPSTGAMTPEQQKGDTEASWAGNATSVTFTVGATASLGTESDQKGQFRFTKIIINGGAGGTTPDNPENPGTPDDPGTPDQPSDPGTVGTPGASVTIDAAKFVPENEDDGVLGTITDGNYSFIFSKGGNSQSAPAHKSAWSDVRLYAKNTMEVKAAQGKMAKMVFTLTGDTNQKNRYTTVTPSTGAISPAQQKGDTEFIWVGDASSVTFTIGDIATLGDESTKPGQIRFKSVEIFETAE